MRAPPTTLFLSRRQRRGGGGGGAGGGGGGVGGWVGGWVGESLVCQAGDRMPRDGTMELVVDEIGILGPPGRPRRHMVGP